MNTLQYKTLDRERIGDLKPLWEKLRAHHSALSKHFADEMTKFTFESRIGKVIEKSIDGQLRIEVAYDGDHKAGYCIASLTKDGTGEVDSLFVEEDYRKHGVGRTMMENALSWLKSKQPKQMTLTVAVGNERVLKFYEGFGFYPRHIVLLQKSEK